jgi:hypothetical protein
MIVLMIGILDKKDTDRCPIVKAQYGKACENLTNGINERAGWAPALFITCN